MIKRCPTCNRTYSDESISFCLADGALLSAPIDSSREEPPATEILPSSRIDVQPTQPAQSAVPTMTSLPGAHQYSAPRVNEPKQSRALVWATVALLAVAVVIIGTFAARKLFTNRNSPPPATSTPEETVAQNLPNATISPAYSGAGPTPQPSSRPNVVSPQPDLKNSPTPGPATLQTDPVLFPPNKRPTTPTKPEPATDYSQPFKSNEVDSRARVLDKPEPQYTEAARNNQVTGTIVLRAVFSSSGSVTNISVIRGLPYGLNERAIAAARQIRFVPAMKDGHPVSMWMQLEYNFNLY